MGFPEPDFDVYEIHQNLKPGFMQDGYICEGCGLLAIAKPADCPSKILVYVKDKWVDYETITDLKFAR